HLSTSGRSSCSVGLPFRTVRDSDPSLAQTWSWRKRFENPARDSRSLKYPTPSSPGIWIRHLTGFSECKHIAGSLLPDLDHLIHQSCRLASLGFVNWPSARSRTQRGDFAE